MNASTKLNVGYVAKEVATRFAPHIDISDKTNASLAQQEVTLKTRGLAAFALSSLVEDLDEAIAAAHVTDGSKDCGIDALYIDEATKVVYVVQSKWHESGTGSIALGDLHKTLAGLRYLMEEQFDRFNSKFEHIFPALETALSDPETIFELVLTTTGESSLGEEVEQALTDALEELNELSELLRVRQVGLAQLRAFIIQGSASHRIDAELSLMSWGPLTEPYSAYFGLIHAQDLVDLYLKHGGRLFDKNLRKALGATPVNAALIATVKSTPENFWYFNNGVTVLCERISKSPKGAASRISGDFAVEGLSVVNGAQTVSSLTTVAKESPDSLDAVLVWIRVISLEGAPDEFANDVTRSTNTQNSVEASDFFALDSEQLRLKEDLRLSLGLDYVFRRGETAPVPSAGTSASEALVSLACAHRDSSFAVIAKSAVGRLEERAGRYYPQLINASTSPHALWNSVQVLREVEIELVKARKSSEGRKSAVAQQGNRIIAHVVMQRLGGVGALASATTIEDRKELVARAREDVPKVLEAMTDRIASDFANNYVTSLFKNAERCVQLVASTMEDIDVNG